MSDKIMRCWRCNRRMRRDNGDWNIEFDKGLIVGLVCPSCQTAEEHAEAEINNATVDYQTMRIKDGRIQVAQKVFP